MDGMTHVSATSRWGYSYTRSFGGVSYQDIRSLFAAAGEFIISTPFAAAALYAEDPKILDDPRIANPEHAVGTEDHDGRARDRALNAADGSAQLENLRAEEETLLAVMHNGGTVILGTDSPSRGSGYSQSPWASRGSKVRHETVGSFADGNVAACKSSRIRERPGGPSKQASWRISPSSPAIRCANIKDAANVKTVIVDGRVYSMSDLMAPFSK